MSPEPQRIAHYRILRKIGSGGMGDVYLAEDERLPRQVALKVISGKQAGDETLRRRFIREAHAVSAISHAGVAHIYEVGKAEGTDFIAMEFVEGQTLASRLEREPMPMEEVLDVSVQLADAIAEAHDRGVIHRDIKPSNIMLTHRGRVKVLDFGLAKIDTTAPEESSEQTASVQGTSPGMIVGTVNYMSPEQAMGDPVDRRSDVFSLGIVLYAMITRRLPFTGRNTADTLHRITFAEPEPLARFNYDLPIELERIVRRCLEKAPDRRYPSARALHADLDALVRDRSGAPHVPWLERARSRSRRLTWPAAILIGSAILVSAGLLLRERPATLPQPRPAIRAVAVLPFTNETAAGADEYITEGFTDTAINHLAEDSNLRVMARSTVFRFRRSTLFPQQIGRQLGVDAVVTGAMTMQSGRARLVAELVSVKDGSRVWGDEYEAVSSDLISIEKQLMAGLDEAFGRRRVAGPAPPAAKARTEAHNLFLRGQYAFHARRMTEAMTVFQSAIEADPSYAPPYAAQAEVASVLERYADVPAAQTAPGARAAAARALELDPDLPEAHVALASIYETYDRNWPAAESEYRKAIALRPADALAHQWYALLLSRLGRHEEALREVSAAEALDPLSAVVQTARAGVLYYARRRAEAMAPCTKAIELDGSSVLARVQLGLLLDQQGRATEAADVLAAFGEAPRLSNVGMAALALVEAHAGNSSRARELLRELETRSPAQSIEYFAAAIHAALGDRDAAFSWLNRAFTAHSTYLGYAKVDPVLDPLRSDARFKELLVRLHLE